MRLLTPPKHIVPAYHWHGTRAVICMLAYFPMWVLMLFLVKWECFITAWLVALSAIVVGVWMVVSFRRRRMIFAALLEDRKP